MNEEHKGANPSKRHHEAEEHRQAWNKCALVVAASAAFIAAFLNAAFAYCLGCQLYVLLVRAGIIRRSAARA
jgi:hypothetical protein